MLKEMKLKFHVPKKDLCGICESYNNGSDEEKEQLQPMYDKHIQEKQKAREIKDNLKITALSKSSTFQSAVFDLQQVIYLPKSERGELFYKRRLSCYNFTVYELGTKEGYCFFHHEGLAGRGANEIASNLYKYLTYLDNQGKQEVANPCHGLDHYRDLESCHLILSFLIVSFILSHYILPGLTLPSDQRVSLG